jgi:hypothetical protein
MEPKTHEGKRARGKRARGKRASGQEGKRGNAPLATSHSFTVVSIEPETHRSPA